MHILYDQTRRTPIVIPVINEVEGGDGNRDNRDGRDGRDNRARAMVNGQNDDTAFLIRSLAGSRHAKLQIPKLLRSTQLRSRLRTAIS